MGVRFPSSANTVIQNVTIVTTAETVVAVTNPISQSLTGAAVLLLFTFGLSTGAATSFLTYKIRRGITVAGTQINVNMSHSIAGGVALTATISYVDLVPGDNAQVQYALTITANGATGNATVGDVSAIAMVL